MKRRAWCIAGDIYVAIFVICVGCIYPTLVGFILERGLSWAAPLAALIGVIGLMVTWSIHRDERKEQDA